MYELPGQKKDTPDELDCLRMFYESMYNENPQSELAEKWCLIHGIIPRNKLDAVIKKHGIPGKVGGASTPKTAPAPLKKGQASPAVKNEKAPEVKKKEQEKNADSDDDVPLANKKKIIKDDSDSDDDVPLAKKVKTEK